MGLISVLSLAQAAYAAWAFGATDTTSYPLDGSVDPDSYDLGGDYYGQAKARLDYLLGACVMSRVSYRIRDSGGLETTQNSSEEKSTWTAEIAGTTNFVSYLHSHLDGGGTPFVSSYGDRN